MHPHMILPRGSTYPWASRTVAQGLGRQGASSYLRFFFFFFFNSNKSLVIAHACDWNVMFLSVFLICRVSYCQLPELPQERALISLCVSERMSLVWWSVCDRGNMKRFQSGSDKRKKKREEEKLREKLPKLTKFFQSKNLSVENEDISDNVSSAAGPSLAIASSSRHTATSAPTSPACLASKNDEPSSCTTAAHIPDTDTCTEDAQDTAMVIIPAQAQLDDNESSDVSNVSNPNDTVK